VMTGNARFVGRIGALAVALGVGSVVAWVPVALADASGAAGSAGSRGSESASSSSAAAKAPSRGSGPKAAGAVRSGSPGTRGAWSSVPSHAGFANNQSPVSGGIVGTAAGTTGTTATADTATSPDAVTTASTVTAKTIGAEIIPTGTTAADPTEGT